MVLLLPRRRLIALGLGLACALGALGAGARLARAGSGAPSRARTAVPHNVIWSVQTSAPEVAITFDDGPDPVFTPQVLSTLARYGARATFFVLGAQARQLPAIVRAEAAEGSEVCNHGWAHTMLRGRSAGVVRQNVVRTRDLLHELGVPACDLFRFPYFASDATARQVVAGLGYRIVGANIDTLDWTLPNPRRMAEQALARLRPGDIILFHDGGGPRTGTVQALSLVLDGLPRRGLRAVTVTQLLAGAEHGRPPVQSADA